MTQLSQYLVKAQSIFIVQVFLFLMETNVSYDFNLNNQYSLYRLI